MTITLTRHCRNTQLALAANYAAVLGLRRHSLTLALSHLAALASQSHPHASAIDLAPLHPNSSSLMVHGLVDATGHHLAAQSGWRTTANHLLAELDAIYPDTAAQLATVTSPDPATGTTRLTLRSLTAAGHVADNDTARVMLDLSTAHLPEDLGAGGLPGAEGVNVYPWLYGYLMHVPGDIDARINECELPPREEVVRIWRHAETAGASWVLFDRDGRVEESLPTWDW